MEMVERSARRLSLGRIVAEESIFLARRFAVYRSQMIECPPSADVVDSLLRLDSKKRLFKRIDVVDDVNAALALLSAVLAGAICQLTYVGFTTGNDFKATGRLPVGFEDTCVFFFFDALPPPCALPPWRAGDRGRSDLRLALTTDLTRSPPPSHPPHARPDAATRRWAITTLKALMTLSSTSMMAVMAIRCFLLHHIRVVEHSEPPRSSPCPAICPFSCSNKDKRCAVCVYGGGARNWLLCRFCYMSPGAWRTVLEMAVCAIHVPPMVDFSITMRLPLWNADDVEYDMHVNVMSLLAASRLYVLLRTLRNRAGYRTPHAAYIGKINGVRSNSVSFTLKRLLKKAPWTTVIVSVFTCLFATTVLLWFVEKVRRPPPHTRPSLSSPRCT
jgi:hypothetical protein